MTKNAKRKFQYCGVKNRKKKNLSEEERLGF